MHFRHLQSLRLLPALLTAGFLFLSSTSQAALQSVSDPVAALGLQLVGVVETRSCSQALLTLAGTEDPVLVGQGDLIAGFTVVSIAGDTIELVRGGERLSVATPDVRRVRPDLSGKIACATPPPVRLSPPDRNLTAPREPGKIEVAQQPSFKQRISTRLALNARPLFQIPIQGEVTSAFGLRQRPRSNSGMYGSMVHKGVDIAGPYGAAVLASAAGTVIESGSSFDRGQYIVLQHSGGYETAYYHLSRRHVREGASVRAGQRIGSEGSSGISTGPHLHFEIRRNGVSLNPTIFLPSLR